MIRGMRPTVFGFPNSIITKLRYVDELNLTSTVGGLTTNVFAANGIFDPDITGIGHQPMYRDNFAALYDQYVVLGSKITVKATNIGTSSGVILGITGDDDFTLSTTFTTRMEQNNSVYTLLGQQGSGHDYAELVMDFSPLRDFGVAVKDDGSSATAVASNPSEIWTFGVWINSTGGAATNSVHLTVEIEYTVKFTELQTPVQN